MKKQKKQFQSLFTSMPDWESNSCLNWSSNPLYTYTTGYKEAADALVNMVLEKSERQDVLVYPICFLYRHYIELSLKEIISSGQCLLGGDTGFPQHHKISNLYGEAKKIIKKVFSSLSYHPDLSFIDHVISEYAQIDPQSISFRYPRDKDGKNMLEGIIHINLRHLSENIKRFGEEIDSISMAMPEYL